MNRPDLRAGVRPRAIAVVLAPVLAVGLAGTGAAIVSISKASQLSELSAQILTLQQESARRSAALEAEIRGVSTDLSHLSRSIHAEMASARRGSQTDAARLGSRLADDLGLLSDRLDSLARQAAPAPPSAGPPAPANPPQPSNPTPPPEPARTAVARDASAGPSGDPAFGLVPDPTADPAHDLAAVRKLREAQRFFECGDYAQARSCSSAALTFQPDNTTARLYHAASLFRTNPSDSSAYPVIVKELQTVLQREGENPLALETLALTAVERARWSEGMEYFARRFAVSPGSARLFRAAAFCAFKAGDEEAARCWMEAASEEQAQ